MELRFSDVFLKVLEFSRDEALRTGWHNICPDHIMLAIMRHSSNDACLVLESAGIDTALFKEQIDAAVFVDEAVPWEERDSINLCESSISMLQHAALEATRCGSPVLEPLHFLLAVCRVAGCYSHDFLSDGDISLRALVEASGLEWSQYGLDSRALASGGADASTSASKDGLSGSSSSEDGHAGNFPDASLLAAALERRLREGYTTDNPLAS